ncbi:MAG: hypothetical protein DRN27_06650 [Thermoplasmata archaeon]|nr:MAG: hypothetical protein DRN27_06650 [Thermoplasmata archaeon]
MHRREYNALLEKHIENIDSDGCDCEDEPVIYIPIVCEIVAITIFTIGAFLEMMAFICKILGNYYLVNDLLDLEHMLFETVIPIFC